MRTTVNEIKAELRAEFRGWSIITTDAGRWWATRGPKRGDLVQPGPYRGESVNDSLDLLVHALAVRGMGTRRRPELLHVFDPETPCFGDSVRVGEGPDGDRWFISSTGAPLAPCWDLPCAAERLVRLIEAFRCGSS